MANSIFIKKFRFKSFDENAYEELKSVTFQGFVNEKILSVFVMDDVEEKTFFSLSCMEITRRRRISKIVSPGDVFSLRKTNNYKVNLKFYSKDELKDFEIKDYFFASFFSEEELFIKSLYLYNGLVAFIYYRDGNFYVDILEIKEEDSIYSIFYYDSYEIFVTKKFDIDESLNDLVKINDERFAFIYTSSSYTCILLINIDCHYLTDY